LFPGLGRRINEGKHAPRVRKGDHALGGCFGLVGLPINALLVKNGGRLG